MYPPHSTPYSLDFLLLLVFINHSPCAHFTLCCTAFISDSDQTSWSDIVWTGFIVLGMCILGCVCVLSKGIAQCEEKSNFAASCLGRRGTVMSPSYQFLSESYPPLDFAAVVHLVWSSSYSMSVPGTWPRAHKSEVVTSMQELTLTEFSMTLSAIWCVSQRPFSVNTTKTKLSNHAKIRPFITRGGSWDNSCFPWRESAEDWLNL